MSSSQAITRRSLVRRITFSIPQETNSCSDKGRKKIDQIENELKRLTKLASYDHVQRVFAAQMTGTRSNQPARLVILMEKRPPLTLRDVLQECDGLREERIIVSWSASRTLGWMMT